MVMDRQRRSWKQTASKRNCGSATLREINNGYAALVRIAAASAARPPHSSILSRHIPDATLLNPL
jgi:hypothetical protein